MRHFNFLKYFFLFLPFLTACQESPSTSSSPPTSPTLQLQAIPKHARLIDSSYYTWGASMVRDAQGICHLYYARWPRSSGFKGWLKESEIAYATATQPTGPYEVQDFVFTGRGEGHWDEIAAHNPHIKAFEGRYYLYYISNKSIDLGLDDWHNHIYNQRIGVAVADHPSGPWERLDAPVLDLQEGKPAHGYITNPSVCQRPEGGYLMLFKTRPPNSETSGTFTTIHAVATAPSPTGPFTIAPEPILTKATAEDPFVWSQAGKYYAIVKDMYGKYTGQKSLALFESSNGFDWQPAAQAMVSPTLAHWEDGRIDSLQHLERPQIWLDEAGRPAVLFCAAAYAHPDSNRNWNTFNLHIPLQPSRDSHE